MPQAWIVSQLNCSLKVRNIAGGQAEPPTTLRFKLSSLDPDCVAAAIKPCQMVGTPSATETLYVSIRFTRLAPSRPGPGSTSVHPTMAAAYGVPHAFTWNIGTTGNIISAAETFSESGKMMA